MLADQSTLDNALSGCYVMFSTVRQFLRSPEGNFKGQISTIAEEFLDIWLEVRRSVEIVKMNFLSAFCGDGDLRGIEESVSNFEIRTCFYFCLRCMFY